jgi:hypothetical protein
MCGQCDEQDRKENEEAMERADADETMACARLIRELLETNQNGEHQ